MNVSIIIPNYNGERLLEKNMPEVLVAKKQKQNKIVEIIVVDNGSSDNSVKILKERFPEVKIVRHKKNRGFSAAVNTGARTAKGELLVLINTDVRPSKNFLTSIFQHFKNKSVFGVSLHEEGYGWARGRFQEGYIVHEPGRTGSVAHDTFWVSGGSGVYKRKLWMKLGGMDEKLLSPFYWEDIDLSYRASKRGLRLVWEPKARVVHKHESTANTFFTKRHLNRIQERNQLLFIWKNLTSSNLVKQHLKGLAKRALRHPGYIIVLVSALFKLRIALKARKKEKKECKVSDEAVLARFANA